MAAELPRQGHYNYGEIDTIQVLTQHQMNIGATTNRVPLGNIASDDDLRSEFMRSLISAPPSRRTSPVRPPSLLVQFWDDASDVPLDVQACLDSWAPLEQSGFTRLLFDDTTALRFIDDYFTPREVLAFNNCGHPAMRADYFRLCFMVRVGGLYVDADDRYLGQSINGIFGDGCLQLQPLCYDIPSDSMLNPYAAATSGQNSSRIFYVNNNPLIASSGHPLIFRALERATDQIISPATNERDIQSITGPGNLTACLVEHALALQAEEAELDFTLLPNWDATAVSTWPLQYRSDERNWRKWAHNNG